ncbi:MAG: hypothetical protein E6R03_02515 [Hyphomicrobiaceae bacterium]|nr:MAG: hypothetical protein E6R03_02515 [Hyphomicrobiaceae bacterium]
MDSNLQLRDFYVGACVLAWWVGVVLVFIATWPLLGLVGALASAGLHLRGSPVDFDVNYKVLTTEVHTPRWETDPHPFTYFLAWATGTGLWVGMLLAILGVGGP